MVLLTHVACYLSKPRRPTPGVIMCDLFFGLYLGFTILAIQKTVETLNVATEVLTKNSDNLSAGTLAVIFAALSVFSAFITMRYQSDKLKNNNSPAEELNQLASLLERGYLTRSEFNHQKEKILIGNPTK